MSIQPETILDLAGDSSHMADVDGAWLVQDDDFDGAEPLSPVPSEAALPEMENIDKKTFMPNAFTVPGLQHIAHNLLDDVHSGMMYWPTFWNQLKILEGFLRMAERRQRYVWTHLSGTLWEPHSCMFSSFSYGLYEQRWRSIVTFLKHASLLLPVLAATWDAEKYIRGVDSPHNSGDHRPAQASDGVALID